MPRTMPEHETQDPGERRFQSGQGARLSRALAAVAVFYVAGILLNGVALHHGAERRPYGFWQRVWVAGTQPLDWASRVTHAGAFRAWADRWMPGK